ncbi:M16 family metallopeptidase, partial [Nocardiopsis mangrovi]
MARPPVHRMTLGNGLRVVLAPDGRVPVVGVSVHYGVGFRSEPPGRAGFAHLFEHLMFRGSENLPDGRFYDHILGNGGEANGTTRQDYTEYFQKVPAAQLGPALFSEADRMRAPLFTESAVREQVAGVAREIAEATVGRVLGGFPWPALPGVAYGTWADAHDGYGRTEDLLATTPEECADFFDRHYAPGNAVLTVAGGFGAEQARAWVERLFGDIPARPHAAGPAETEGAWTRDRWAAGTEPGIGRTAVAFAHRLPDPRADLDGYLAHMVLADLLGGHRPIPGAEVVLESGCGFFEPLDALDPDTLVTTALLPDGIEAVRVRDAVRGFLAGRAASPETAVLAAEAADRFGLRHHRRHGDPMRLARSLGRMELLFGRAPLVYDLPEMMRALPAEKVAGAAASLAAAPLAALELRPGPHRTRPGARAADPEAEPRRG